MTIEKMDDEIISERETKDMLVKMFSSEHVSFKIGNILAEWRNTGI
jgi:hypothetical protein